MTPKDQFRSSVLSAIHDEALSISDAIDPAYAEHVAGKDARIERLRGRSTKLEQLLSEALRQGWLAFVGRRAWSSYRNGVGAMKMVMRNLSI